MGLVLPSPKVGCSDEESPIYISTGSNKGWDITQIKEKNAFFLVRQALKKLYSRQELIEGMLSPRKDTQTNDCNTQSSTGTPGRHDLSPTRKKTLKGLAL